MKDIEICKADIRDAAKVIDLFNLVWADNNYDKDEKASFVLSNPQNINYCAKNGGNIVGTRFSIYENIYIGFTPKHCIQVCDTCTHPSFRGMGIMGKMNEKILSTFFEECQGDLIYNIGVPASRHVNEKYGWKYIESLYTIFKIQHPFRVITKIGFDIRKLSDSVTWYTHSTEPTINSNLLNIRNKEFCDLALIHNRYDENFLRQRLKFQATICVFEDKHLGSILYKKGISNGLVFVTIGEVFLYENDRNNFCKLLRSFQNQENPDVIKNVISKGHPHSSFYKACGYLKYKYLHLGYKVQNRELEKICSNPERWALSAIDMDTF